MEILSTKGLCIRLMLKRKPLLLKMFTSTMTSRIKFGNTILLFLGRRRSKISLCWIKSNKESKNNRRLRSSSRNWSKKNSKIFKSTKKNKKKNNMYMYKIHKKNSSSSSKPTNNSSHNNNSQNSLKNSISKTWWIICKRSNPKKSLTKNSRNTTKTNFSTTYKTEPKTTNRKSTTKTEQ